jgi:hypothetical protein
MSRGIVDQQRLAACHRLRPANVSNATLRAGRDHSGTPVDCRHRRENRIRAGEWARDELELGGGTLSRIDRKSRIREYKQTPLAAGIYRIRNTAAGRSLIGSSVNPAGRLNRHRFQLKAGSHPDARLQADWNELGEEGFELAVLDRLEPRDEPDYDPSKDLEVLKELWLEKLSASGESLYGKDKET